jgi:hypothetical protein
MRNALHRAVLRRFVLRLSVLAAFAIAFAALVTPEGWLLGDPVAARAWLVGGALALVAVPVGLGLGRKPRARVTAPRPAMSEA